MILIRTVESRDCPSTTRIVADVFREYGMTFAPEGWDKDVAQPHVHYAGPDAMFLVAEENGKIVGMGGAHVDSATGHAELHRVYLDPAERGKGLGTRLCRQIEEWAIRRKVPRMVLWSDLRFTHAHAMYRKLGYRIFGCRTIDDPDRSVEFGMERDLGQAPSIAPDPLTTPLRASIRAVPLGTVRPDSALWHHARFAAAGILAWRKKQLPMPQDVFQGKSDLNRIEFLVADGNTVVGFRRQLGSETVASAEEIPHPSCES